MRNAILTSAVPSTSASSGRPPRSSTLRRARSFAAAVTVVAVGVGTAASCSSDGDGDTESQDPVATETTDLGAETSSTAAPDDSSQLEAPIIIDGAQDVTVKVGQFLDVVTDGVTKVETDNSDVLKVSQPSDDGSAQFNAGAEVVQQGSATLTVYGEDDEELYVVRVLVE